MTEAGKGREFPLLYQGREEKALRSRRESVPWAFIAEHEAQAKANYDQSLETLASRGGLSPKEMLYAVQGRRLRGIWLDGMTEAEALNQVEAKLKEWEARSVATEQPAPIANSLPAVWDLVRADMAARDAIGRARYGVPLRPHNGRDALRDAFEEALDLCAYLRQAIYERDSK